MFKKKKIEEQVLFLGMNRLKDLQVAFGLRPFCPITFKTREFRITVIQNNSVIILKAFLVAVVKRIHSR